MGQTLDRLFGQMRSYAIFDMKQNNILSVVEAAALILGGAFVDNLTDKFTLDNFVFALIFLSLGIYLLWRRTAKESTFTLSALGEMEATASLNAKMAEVDRKTLIDTYIDDAVKSLNENTCNYNGNFAEQNLCNSSIADGLTSVFAPYFNNPQSILHSSKSKFTVGCYLNYVCAVPEGMGKVYVEEEIKHLIFTPRDDFQFGKYYWDNYLSSEGPTPPAGDAYHLWSQMLETFNSGKFVKSIRKMDEHDITYLTVPVPTVCEDGSQGVFFVIAETIADLPADIEKVSLIFCRLFANWLNKYNECVINRIEKANDRLSNGIVQGQIKIIVPQEVIELQEKKASES